MLERPELQTETQAEAGSDCGDSPGKWKSQNIAGTRIKRTSHHGPLLNQNQYALGVQSVYIGRVRVDFDLIVRLLCI